MYAPINHLLKTRSPTRLSLLKISVLSAPGGARRLRRRLLAPQLEPRAPTAGTRLLAGHLDPNQHPSSREGQLKCLYTTN